MHLRIDDLNGPEIRDLLDEHLRDMHATSPRESVHALDLDALRVPSITFWTAWDGGTLLGCGALRELDPTHGEVKSMRTSRMHRGRGVARTLLERVVAEARARDYARLSLETGSMAFFAPARRLYASAGFVRCGPFGDYRPDPNSAYLTLDLRAPLSAVEIRRFDADDWAAYRTLRLRALRDAPDAFGSTFERESAMPDAHWAERLAQGAASPSQAPLVATRDGRAVGLAWARLDPSDPSAADLFQMWVAPEGRGAGLGTRLLRAAVDWARARGATSLRLCVTEGDTVAAHLYRANGFEPVGEASPLREGSPLQARTMVLPLGGGATTGGRSPQRAASGVAGRAAAPPNAGPRSASTP